MAARDRDVARALNSIAVASGFTSGNHALTEFIADYFTGEPESDGRQLTVPKTVCYFTVYR